MNFLCWCREKKAEMGNCWCVPARNQTSSVALTSVERRKDISTAGNSSVTTTCSSGGSKKSELSSSSGDNNDRLPNGHLMAPLSLKVFTFSELKSATRNFKMDSLLGEGGFGQVFKGWLDDNKATSKGTLVAVKKLKSESMQGHEEWQSEVNFLGRLSHPNLVKLFGYCWEEDELLLVYEFMQKGSLENHLFGRGSVVQPLPWDLRLKIAIGAAQGLFFLHTSDHKVIYRDFKASNILLDGSYTPKISDFGLAKFGPTASQSHVTTRVIGTHGYAAPEYVATGHLYVKSDVYGFGVVLVEILTGLRALDTNRPNGKQNLVDWVKPYLTDRRKLTMIMDTRLEGRYPSRAAIRIAQLAVRCLESEPKNRPGMKEVLETLKDIEDTKEKPNERRMKSPQLAPVQTGSHHRSLQNPNGTPQSLLKLIR